MPSGRTKYTEAYQWDAGSDPAEGIWYVARTKSGRSYTWLTERLEDLPVARTAASMMPHRDAICKVLMDPQLVTPADVFMAICRAMEE